MTESIPRGDDADALEQHYPMSEYDDSAIASGMVLTTE